jgi:hypothetical protein
MSTNFQRFMMYSPKYSAYHIPSDAGADTKMPFILQRVSTMVREHLYYVLADQLCLNLAMVVF